MRFPESESERFEAGQHVLETLGTGLRGAIQKPRRHLWVLNDEITRPEELPDLLERLKEKTAEFEEEVVETVTLWDRWPPMLMFVGLLSTEWYLRKRWGLV